MAFFPGPFDALPTLPESSSEGAFGRIWYGKPILVDVDLDGQHEVVGGHISAETDYGGEVANHWPGPGEVTQWLGAAEGAHAAPYLAWDLDSLGDQDDDGVVELLLSTYSAPAYVVPGDAPSGAVGERASSAVDFAGGPGGDCATADLNGDGILDLALGEGIYVGPFLEDRHRDDAEATLGATHPLLLTHPAGSGSPELWGFVGEEIVRVEDPLLRSGRIASWQVGPEMDTQILTLGDVDRDGWLETTIRSADDEPPSVFVLTAEDGAWDVREDAILELRDLTRPALVELGDGGVGLVALRGTFLTWEHPNSSEWLLYEVY
jgi:hypothetical protein